MAQKGGGGSLPSAVRSAKALAPDCQVLLTFKRHERKM